jgi:hypothetical protein
MAITQYTEPATVNPSLTDWQNSIARDNASSRGFAEVDLDDYEDGATAPKVAVGSRFDNNGALYVVSGAAESISGIAGISNSTTFYVYFDVSAGVFLASTTAPTFDKEKRGWYNGNDRALFRIYKDSSGEYDKRGFIENVESISSDLDIKGELSLFPNISSLGDRVRVNTSVSSGSQLTLDAGIYYLALSTGGASTGTIDIFLSTSSWLQTHFLGNSDSWFGLFFSDGTNIRINCTAGSVTVNYFRLSEQTFA